MRPIFPWTTRKMDQPELRALRARIAGPETTLVIEAPAGYGKTEEAVVAAQTVAAGQTPPGCSVLFLTHTNAARDTFNRRLGRAAAVMKTIHALAEDIVDMYAMPLGYPRPLDPLRHNPSFDDLLVGAADLLRRRPEIARGLALRFPFILVDEYQDCTTVQHELIQLIAAAAPTRLRMFGDHLQAIYEFAGAQVDWADLTRAHPTVELTTPWRWRNQPNMAKFLVDVRRGLVQGRAIDLRDRPTCVRVSRWGGRPPSAFQAGHAAECIAQLRTHARPAMAVLTHTNQHALGLRRRMPGYGKFHEGRDYDPARAMIEAVSQAHGDPPTLVALLVKAMQHWGVGMTEVHRRQVREICQPHAVVTGGKVNILPFARICQSLYERPSVDEWLCCLRRVLNGEHQIKGWKILRPDQLYLLARLRPAGEDVDLLALLHREAQIRDAVSSLPPGGFMTIHKAKGLQFPAVAIPYCSAELFPNELPARRRLYVAMTRAQTHLHLLIPLDDPSPLLLTP